MKRWIIVVVSLCLVMALSSSSVFALATGVVAADTYVSKGDPFSSQNGGYLLVATDGPCAPATNGEITFLRWDVRDAIGKVGSAQMTLTMADLNTSKSPVVQVTLYKVADDTWTEDGLVYNYPTVGSGGPALGDAIQTVDIPTGYMGPVVFGAPYAPSALAAYLATQAVHGDGYASFALLATACADDAIGVTLVFYDKENGSAISASGTTNAPAAPLFTQKPYLQVWTPTAVELSTFHAAAPATSWPLIAAAGVLGLVALGIGLRRLLR